MKRYTACLLIMLLLASCGEESAAPEVTGGTDADTTAAPVETNRLTELGNKDFGGKIYTVLDANDYPATHINMPGEEMNGDLINDALFKRDTKIEELYNTKIEYVQITNAKAGTDALRNSVLAGEDAYNLCISTVCGGRLATLATEGLLANLCNIPYLTLDSNWWSKLMYESCRLNDTMYFTTGDISTTVYLVPACVYLNQTLLDNYKIDTDFYQIVRDGKWTVDELLNVTKDAASDLNQDNTMHVSDDFFGLVYQTNALTASMMLVGCGLSLSDNDGQSITMSLNSERAANVVEKLRLISEPIQYQVQNDIFNVTFKDDRAIALIHSIGTAKNYLRDMNSDYLVLPMPKYDEAQTSYRSMINGWGDCFVGIPKNADAEFTGFITEALAYESYENVRPQMYDLVLKQKAARDEGSAHMLDIVFDTTYLDFMGIYEFAGLPAGMANVVFQDAPLASTLASYQEAANSAITDFTEAWTQK